MLRSVQYTRRNVPQLLGGAAVIYPLPSRPALLRPIPSRVPDLVGLDICQSVAENLAAAYDFEVPAGLSRFVDNKHLGKKSGRGFYQYKKGKAPSAVSMDPELSTTQNRMGMHCLTWFNPSMSPSLYPKAGN